MLNKLFQKTFISIISTATGYEILHVSLKNKNVLFKKTRTFADTIISETMLRYIQSAIEPSPFFYISTLNTHSNQGAYKGCDGLAGMQTLCRNQSTQYTSYDALADLSEQYDAIGLDFIFSPFSMLEFYFADKINTTFALYALATPDMFSIAIFDNGKLEYAYHYTYDKTPSLGASHATTPSMEFSVLPDEDPAGSVVLDDIEEMEELDLLEDLDIFDDIEDLDELDAVSEFTQDILTFEEKRIHREKNENLAKLELDNASEEYQKFTLIRKALEYFYTSPNCGNRFIETVCIADSYHDGYELKNYLEEELFLNVLIRRVNLCEGIHALAVMEEENL